MDFMTALNLCNKKNINLKNEQRLFFFANGS